MTIADLACGGLMVGMVPVGGPPTASVTCTLHHPVIMIAAYRHLGQRRSCPLHLGVTEAGPPAQGTLKFAVAFGIPLAEGIGDTIRVSRSGPPADEARELAGTWHDTAEGDA